MAQIIELFGEEVISMPPSEFKEEIKQLDFTWEERRSYLMHEYSTITGHKWSVQDFKDVRGRPR